MKVVGSTETLGLLKTLYIYFYAILTRVTFLFLNMFPSPGYRTIFKTQEPVEDRNTSYNDHSIAVSSKSSFETFFSNYRLRQHCRFYGVVSGLLGLNNKSQGLVVKLENLENFSFSRTF